MLILYRNKGECFVDEHNLINIVQLTPEREKECAGRGVGQ